MKFWTSILLTLLTIGVQAQTESVEMADTMRSNGKIYVVVGVILIIFVGIVINMIRIERKINRLEKGQQS